MSDNLLPPDELQYINSFVKKQKLKKLADYYKTEHWATVKRLRRTCGIECCYVCDTPEDAIGESHDLHHRTYENIGKERGQDLVWLCRVCHSEYHHMLTSRLLPQTMESVFDDFRLLHALEQSSMELSMRQHLSAAEQHQRDEFADNADRQE